MKTSAIILVIAASASAASEPCAIPSLLATLMPLQSQIPACTEASSYNLMQLATGTAPTADQVQKLASSQGCKDVYAALQKTVAAIAPPCSIGGVETTTFTTVAMSDGIAALLKALSGSPTAPGASTAAPSGNSTSSANSTITAAPGNGTSKNSSNSVTTPAPTKPSSATATGVALTAAAVTMLAAMA